jgi:outer membrane protein OmpA-like peptidoglycan-associated protein
MKLLSKLLIGSALITPAYFCNAQFADPVVSYTGSIIDQTTKVPAAAVIEVYDLTGTRINKAKSNAKDGYYFLTGLKPGQTYTIKISDTRYLHNEFEVETPRTDKYIEYSKDILVVPAKQDIMIPLSVSPFELNKATLRPGFEFFLNDYIAILEDNPKCSFCVETYPDNNKDAVKNKAITQARSEALRDFLVKKGVDSKRITIKCYDKTDPKNPPPAEKAAKGKRYVGSVYLKLTSL